MSRKTVVSFALMVVFVSATALAMASTGRPTEKSLGDALICQCGCNQTVNQCNHYECSTRAQMQAEIKQEIASGKDTAAILQDFVLKYGVKVLSSPPAKGFDLAAWILPSVGLILGFVVLILIAKRWRRPSPEPQAAGVAPTIDPEILAAVEEEIKKSGIDK